MKKQFTIKDMKPLTAYEVVEGSSDKTFLTGDIIWISENEDINLIPVGDYKQGGWLEKEDYMASETSDFKAVESSEWKVEPRISSFEICVRVKG